MLPSLPDLRQEFRPMFTLALPVVLAELGWMAMGLVDTLMVGRLGPEAIGAVGIGTSLFMGVSIFAIGLLLGLDTLVAQAYGARRVDECHRWLVHGLVLSAIMTIPIAAGLLLMGRALDAWGLHATVLVLAQPYVDILAWSVLPLLLYTAFRRYLQAMGIVRPVMVALFTANALNAFANWVLIFGNLGMPAMGVRGAAWATVISRVGMAAFLLGVIVYRERPALSERSASVESKGFERPGLRDTPLGLEWARMRRLVGLGFPAATQITVEVGVFAAATALAGKLAPVSLAAHQIAINIAAFAFMVPLGISSAAAVRVGHAIGALDPPGASRAGWTALLFGTTFMAATAVLFFTVPHVLIGAFTRDAGVLAVGTTLLFVAAIFQLFDGIQAVATGALRGLGDTRTPMWWNLAGHWAIGLPFGYTLCFVLGFGVIGLWWGLSTGLIICGVALLIVWARRSQEERLKAEGLP